MKMSKKARSMAAVLAVMALTAGVSGVQAATLDEVKETADEAYTIAGTTRDNLHELQGTVQEQATAIEKAQATANGAQAAVDELSDRVSYANQTAQTAGEEAGKAQTMAQNAQATANGAQAAVDKLSDRVSYANKTAQTAGEEAGIAQTMAQAAQTTADTAKKMANENAGKITGIEEQVSTNSQDISALRTDTNTLRGDVNTLRDDTNVLRGDVNTLRTDVDAQGIAISNNTTAISGIKTIVGDGVLSNTNASNLTEAVNQNYAQINNNTQAISALDSRVDDLGGEIDQVGAVSAALAGLHPLDYDGTGSKFQLSAAMGSYDSSQAAAIGAFYHFNRDVMISLGGATAFDGDHKTAGNLGVTFRVGAGASGKAVSDDVMARLEAMDRKITALEQENKDLKNVLGAIDTSLSKEFPDVPANHWAYEAVSKLAGNDIVAGYPDGEFHGDRTMTRYEMAEIIYKAMSKGVQVDQKLVNEFKPEMEQVAANQNA